MPEIPDKRPPERRSRKGRSTRRRGNLIVVEGIDGSGKSTQLQLLHQWLLAQGQRVVLTEWNSSELVRQATRRGKKKNLLTPTTFSLLHATDFADRLTYQITPYLKAGITVLADRYIYTAFARDVARGVHPKWVRDTYAFAPKADLALYFKVPISVSIRRLTASRAKIKFYEAGMDLGLSPDVQESFKLFQGRVLEEYEKMTGEFGFEVIDATQPINKQQEIVRQVASRLYRGRKFGVAA